MVVFISQVNGSFSIDTQYFNEIILRAGTARRGEDGESSKNRRLPKAVKPKKIIKTEGQVIVYASCNNGTTALVTNTGRLIMFGKDTTHCDLSGYVTDLLDQHITKVALGKAHCVALNTKGQVFTFGLNNKGQCGRLKSKVATPWANEKEGSASSQPDDVNPQPQQSAPQKNEEGGRFDITTMCDFDDHKIIHGKCRVCSICRECTGYNISCVITQSTPVENRVPGM